LFYYLREELKMKNYRHIKKIISIIVMGTFLFQMHIWLHAQSEGEIVRQFQKAKNRYLNGQYVNAKTRIERVISIIIEKDISRSDILGGCYLLLGAIYEKEGKQYLAEENYRKATGDCGIMKVEGVDLGSLNLYRKIVEAGIIVQPGTKPKKKFPWLLVAGSVVVVGLVVYFLVLKPKKKYQLTVEWGEGVYGEPGPGTYKYKKGEVVNYSCHMEDGYSQLQVYLDNQPVDPSGQVTMDRDHTLTATANTNVVDFVTDRDSVEIAEGGTAAFKVKLSAQPRTDVHVIVERVSGDSDIHIVPGADLTFTTSDWETFKEVGLQANEDDDDENGTAVIRLSADGIPGKTINALEEDNDKLKIEITEPEQGDVVRDERIIRAEASGKYEITKVEFYIDEKRKKSDNSAPYKYNWHTTSVPDGPHTIKAIVYDMANQTAEDEISVSVSNEKYILTVEKGDGVLGTPASGRIFYNANEVVPYSYSRQEGYTDLQVELDGVVVPLSGKITMNSNHKLEATAQPPPDQYQLTVTKGQGVDGTPDSGTTWHNESETVDYNYSLPEGYTDLEVRVDGTDVSSAGTITMDKNHTLEAIARRIDFETNTAELLICEGGQESFDVRLSGKPPNDVNVTVSRFSGDSDITVVSGENLTFTPTNWEEWQTVTWQAAKDDDDIDDNATIRVQSAQIINPTDINAGEYDLDKHQTPVVWIPNPQDGETACGEVTIRAEIFDNSHIKMVEFYIDDLLKHTDRDSPYNYNWSTKAVPIGTHQIKVMAYDRCNQTGEDDISLYVKDCEPKVSIVNPKEGEILSGTVNIVVSAEDDKGVNSVQVYLQDSEGNEVLLHAWNEGPRTLVSFDFQLDTAAHVNGSYTLKAAAIDTGQQEKYHEISVTMENEPKPGG
jgi:hypothetical protein